MNWTYLDTAIANFDEALGCTRQDVYAAGVLSALGSRRSFPRNNGELLRRIFVPDFLVGLVDAERGDASGG